MVISSKDTNRIWQAIEAQPAKLIRLVKADLKTEISGWTPSKTSKKEFFDEVILPWLNSDTTGGGMFVIQGRNSSQSKPVVLLEIEKQGEEIKAIPMAEKPEDLKLRANQNLLSENADYKYKCQYLEKENEELRNALADLEELNSHLTAEIDEMEKEAEEKENEKPQLSEMQTALLSAAAPVLPVLSEFLAATLKRFMPADSPQQIQPVNQAQAIHYQINSSQIRHESEGREAS